MTQMMSHRATLYIVATPIGNLADMTPRAIAVLQQVDHIVAEDTRHSKPLLRHFGIDTAVSAYHDHSDPTVLDSLLDKLHAGQSMALICDAGTPLIADPGYRLVDAAHAANITVTPIPGACAALAALSVAGLPSDRFIFEGFLAAKSQRRQKQLAALREEMRTIIFYEAPHRLLACLQDMLAVLGGERQLVLARELSKRFETIRRATIADMLAWVQADSQQQRGECVLLLHGFIDNGGINLEARRVLALLREELPLKQAVALAASITGVKKNILYQYALQRTEDGGQKTEG